MPERRRENRARQVHREFQTVRRQQVREAMKRESHAWGGPP